MKALEAAPTLASTSVCTAQLHTVVLCYHTMLQVLSMLRVSILAGCLQSVRTIRRSSVRAQGPTLRGPSLPNSEASGAAGEEAASGVFSPLTAAYVARKSSRFSSFSWVRSSFTFKTLSKSLEKARLHC